MKTRFLVLGLGALVGVVGLAPTSAIAKSATPVTLYGYEEVGPHSLLPDGTPGLEFMQPVCTPSFEACTTYEFFDRWDVAPTGSEVDTTNVEGTVDIHGYDNFTKQSVKGTMALAMTGTTTTWSGSFTGTFRGPNAGTGTFSLAGTDGSKMSGTILFIDDGLMELTGQLK
ncbi:MAG: hypothetical protein QOG34_2181 [Frankiaceae bacterium]|jgi:hypothetical protein|nr:hypothetical protein [Frankiaceae bacterium]